MDQGPESWCPLCDAVMDSKGHHCRQCSAGGDRTVRHNKLRNEVFSFTCSQAGIPAELEKASLLLPARPDASSNQRRPADIYLPSWYGGLPAALDFAVTSPNLSLVAGRAAQEALHAAKSYSETKRAHLGTADACKEAGVTFLPMVCESSGAWAPEAGVVLKHMARRAAARAGRKTCDVFRELLQRLSVTVRSANARAHLRRMGY